MPPNGRVDSRNWDAMYSSLSNSFPSNIETTEYQSRQLERRDIEYLLSSMIKTLVVTQSDFRLPRNLAIYFSAFSFPRPMPAHECSVFPPCKISVNMSPKAHGDQTYNIGRRYPSRRSNTHSHTSVPAGLDDLSKENRLACPRRPSKEDVFPRLDLLENVFLFGGQLDLVWSAHVFRQKRRNGSARA